MITKVGMIRRQIVESQTLYAQIVETLWAYPAGMMYGSFVKKGVKGHSYLYHQYSVDGKQKQFYLGEAAGELVELVETWRSMGRELERLTAMALAGGCLRSDPGSEAVMMRFSESGWFRGGGVLVGSHAFAALGNILGVKWEKEALKTRDVDMAAPDRIAIATKPGIGKVIEEMGYSPIPGLNPKYPPTSYIHRKKRIIIDILTPETGRPVPHPKSLPGCGVSAMPLRFLDYLLDDSVQAAILSSTAVAVRVPNPARFAFHKLILADRRDVSSQVKAKKDLLQAESLFSVLLETRPGDINIAYEALLKRRWEKHIKRGFDNMGKETRERLKEKLG
ncbi:MAG: nucleotidyltransferase domain-containing protein [Nitrospinae bacterium]|nr:nucleotidyltransferase domain-containing protein [Nitrospinota bacterium]